MATRGKKYLEATKLLEPGKAYGPEEAVKIAKQAARAKFDETVELHLRMGLDPRNASQQVRGVVSLPHGLGKKVRVIVFAQGEAARAAETAGADAVGADDLIKKVEDGWLEFDVAIANPDMMGKVSRLGKVLGKKGLMPNPKSGTVVPPGDLARAINDFRKGQAEFRLDRTGIIHMTIGKASFAESQLAENLTTILDAINKAKPAGLKGQYVKSATLTTTMGPGIPLDLSVMALAVH